VVERFERNPVFFQLAELDSKLDELHEVIERIRFPVQQNLMKRRRKKIKM
jgi:hypothetical protein